MTEAAQQLINALSLGSTYALLALGLAMVFSVLRMINFAHGELVTVAGYAMLFTQDAGLPFVLQCCAAVATASVVALLMERLAFHPLRGAGFLTLLLSSFAVSAVIQNVLVLAISPRQKAVAVPEWLNSSAALGPLTVSWIQVATTVATAIALVLLVVFLRRNVSGLAMRAAAEDFTAARLSGVRANRVIGLAFVISGALAGIAAIFFVARRGTVDPHMGLTPVVKAFLATVIGGLGSLQGAVLGGFVLGSLEVALDAALPNDVLGFRDALTLLGVIVILYFRPDGLLRGQAEAV